MTLAHLAPARLPDGALARPEGVLSHP
jgi:hypothetical protein